MGATHSLRVGKKTKMGLLLTEPMSVWQHLSAGRQDQPRRRLEHLLRRRRAVPLYASQSLRERGREGGRKREFLIAYFP